MKSLTDIAKLLKTSKGQAALFVREVNTGIGHATFGQVTYALLQLTPDSRTVDHVIDILNKSHRPSSLALSSHTNLYKSIKDVFAHHLLRDEEPEAQLLIKKVAHVKKRGYFTRAEFLEMCNWKSPRPRQHYLKNPPDRIEALSAQVFVERDEARKIEILDSLFGVNVPVASAILTLTDPENYGVIDVRVWRVLHLYQVVNYDPSGQSISVRHWMDFLPWARKWASELGVSTRNIERTLFEYHKTIQEGTLYQHKSNSFVSQ